VEFRLVYEGPLDSQKSQSRVREKQAIRRALHPQLKELWKQFPCLSTNLGYWADQYHRHGFRFVLLSASARRGTVPSMSFFFAAICQET
jgi:hypothetical protein